jgi:hypothetical protein
MPIGGPQQTQTSSDTNVIQPSPAVIPPAASGYAQRFDQLASAENRSPFRLAAAQPQANGIQASASSFQSTPNPTPSLLNPPVTGFGQATPTTMNASWAGPILDENGNVIGMVPGAGGAGLQYSAGHPSPATVPDYGAAQSFSLPGNAVGPDFSAAPMQFSPVMNFGEIFNYQVNSKWLQSRWDRVSNAPEADGLRGQRVALVTGTNSWDLHGSLTYYFDKYQKCRRITFRGWVGDPSRLTDFLQKQHDFKQQPTSWAGFYLAKNWRKTLGGLLMKNPTVTYVENRVQRVGVLLEMNDAKGSFQLSDDFLTLIDGSQR